MRKEETASTFEIDNQWGKAGEIRTIKTTQQSKSKLVKDSKVVSTSEVRNVGSKRTEKLPKERKVEIINNAKMRVISNQADLQELRKDIKAESKKARDSFKASAKKYKKK